MATKTKAELEAEIKDLKTQLDNRAKVEQYEKAAEDIHNLHVAFITVGFTEEQAWELTKNIVNNGTQPKHSIF